MAITFPIILSLLVWFGEMGGAFSDKCNCPGLENGIVDDLLDTVLKIRGTGERQYPLQKNYPAFSAYITTTQALSSGKIVQFDKIWTNNRNGYNPTTGVFTAPMKGIYHFSVVSMSENGKSLFLSLYQNNTKKAGSYVSENGYKTGTIDIVLHLSKGDTVYIKSGGNQSIFSNGYNYSTFSGYLISQ